MPLPSQRFPLARVEVADFAANNSRNQPQTETPSSPIALPDRRSPCAILRYLDMTASNTFRPLKLFFPLLFLVWAFPMLPAFGVPVGPTRTFSKFAIDRVAPLLSDFDGDNTVDQARLSSSGTLKTIQIALGKSSWHLVSFDSKVIDRGTLFSADIDHDGDIDLVWMSRDASEYVHWLGDGRGNFVVGANTRIVADYIQGMIESSERERVERSTSEFAALSAGGAGFTVLERSGSGGPGLCRTRPIEIATSFGYCCCVETFTPRGPPSRLL